MCNFVSRFLKKRLCLGTTLRNGNCCTTRYALHFHTGNQILTHVWTFSLHVGELCVRAKVQIMIVCVQSGVYTHTHTCGKVFSVIVECGGVRHKTSGPGTLYSSSDTAATVCMWAVIYTDQQTGYVKLVHPCRRG